MGSKFWYALGVIFLILTVVLRGWLWLIFAILCFVQGHRVSKQEKAYYPPPGAPSVQYNVYYPPPAPSPPPAQAQQVNTPYPLVCPYCGQQLSGYDSTCPRCGARLPTRR